MANDSPTETRRPHEPRPAQSRRQTWFIIIGVLTVCSLIALPFYISGLHANPFTSTKRTEIAGQITAQLRDKSELVVNRAEYNNVLVDQTVANQYVPNLWHSDAAYRVNGWVDVTVDTSKIKISIGPDGTATVSLPQPQLSPPFIDLEHTAQVAKGCGINIFCNVDSLTILRTAQGKFRDDAAHHADLMPRSRASAEATMRGLLAPAGVTKVKFSWAPQP